VPTILAGLSYSKIGFSNFLTHLKLRIMFGDMLGNLGNKEGTANQVNELVNRLKKQVGLSDDQANEVVNTIKNFVVEKYPMLQGAVTNIFGNK
jgi:hypothetical protein